jgi:UDP-N-acetyl-D-mannosaminuronic acid dehydrogenase
VREYSLELTGLESALQGAESVVVGTGHDEFRYLDPVVVGERMARRTVFDTVNILNEKRWVDAGFTYWRVGRR